MFFGGFLKIFLMWTIFKVLNLLQYCSVLCFDFFGTEACGILAPWPGIKPTPPAIGRQNLNHWTTREVPHLGFLKASSISLLCVHVFMEFHSSCIPYYSATIQGDPPSPFSFVNPPSLEFSRTNSSYSQSPAPELWFSPQLSKTTRLWNSLPSTAV